MREKKLLVEKRLTVLEGRLDCNKAKDEYIVWKENLNVIYDKIANGMNIRSRCNLIIFFKFRNVSN